MMRFKIVFVLWLLLLGTVGAEAQDVYTSSGKTVGVSRSNTTSGKKGFDPDRMIYGGGVSLGFGGEGYDVWGNYYGSSFTIGASPIVGYRITDRFMAGVGLGYLYTSIKDYYRSPNGTLYPSRRHFITPSVWARFGVLENIFLQGEFEYNMVNYNYLRFDASGNTISQRRTLSGPALLLGGGFRQRVTERSSLLVTVMYNVLQNSEYNPYFSQSNLVYRIGFSIGY